MVGIDNSPAQLAGARPDEEPVTQHPEIVTLEWSRRWPSEEIWKARKR